MNMNIRVMKKDDYDGVYELWNGISGFGIRSIDDSKGAIHRFIDRNPSTSVIVEYKEKIVASILCGHDGRMGYLYHVCVNKDFRGYKLGSRMVDFCKEALKKENINRISLVAFKKNTGGNLFWQSLKFNMKDEINVYELSLNDNNVTLFLD